MLLNFHKLKNKYGMKASGAIVAGASTGQEHNTYRLAKINRICYFEPMISAFKKLQENVSGPDIHLFNCALSDHNGYADMFIANNQQSSSLLLPQEHINQHPDVKFTHKEQVNVHRLDTIMSTLEIPEEFNLLVMDIQGGEGKLIDGAPKTMENIDYVYTEINAISLYKDCILLDELDYKLSQYGLNRVELVMTGHGWGDAFYVKY